MKLKPSDIPDAKVRNWYLEKMVDICDIDQFEYIYTGKLRNRFFDGYEQYTKSNKIDRSNEYWKHLMSIAESPFITSHYQVMSDKEIVDLILQRFDLVKKMELGFDFKYPIKLIPLKYSSYPKNIITKTGKQLVYDALDGYHRIIIARYHNQTEIPVHVSSLELNPHTSDGIIKHMKKTNNWYQPIDFGYKNNFELFHFQNKNDNLHGIGKYEFSLQKHLGDLKNQTIIDLGCNSGVITAAMARSDPKLIIGVDRKEAIQNALYVMGLLWKDYANLSFQTLDLLNVSKFIDLCTSVQPVDCILACNMIYYLGDHVDDVMEVCAKFSPKIILQGNTLKTENGQRVTRMNGDHLYRGEYSQVEPIKNLLIRHGYKVRVDTVAKNYNKPVIVGTK